MCKSIPRRPHMEYTMHAVYYVCMRWMVNSATLSLYPKYLDIKVNPELNYFHPHTTFLYTTTTTMPLVHLSPYCQQQNCPIAASSSSSTTPLMSSYSTPAPSSSSSNTCSDPNNMITHTTISLRKRRMPCQRRRKTHYCYGCEAKVWVHLHSDTLVPICHRCLGAFVVAIREGVCMSCVDFFIVSFDKK